MREATGPDRHKNARHWEIRAEQIRTIRNGAKNPGARACLARIAEDYDGWRNGPRHTCARLATSTR